MSENEKKNEEQSKEKEVKVTQENTTLTPTPDLKKVMDSEPLS